MIYKKGSNNEKNNDQIGFKYNKILSFTYNKKL